MKSVEQLAQEAHNAFCQAMNLQMTPWSELGQKPRAAWIAAVQAVRTEIAAVH